MDNLPRIGIVIPAYNAAPYIGASLESVRAQTYANWFCVVVDDGSRDDTFQVAQDFIGDDPRFMLKRQANAGPSAARNAGYQALPKVDFVIFHDADDVWHREILATLAAKLVSEPEAAAAHALADWIDAEGNPKQPGVFADFGRERHGLIGGKIRKVSPAEPTTFGVLAVGMRVYPMGIVLIRREIIETVGLLDSRYKICHDFDLFLRLATIGHFAFVNKSLCQYRMHSTNITGARKNVAREDRQVFANLCRSPLLSASHRALLKQAARARNDLKVRMWWDALRHEIKAASPAKAGKCAGYLAVNLARSAGSRLQFS